MYSKVINSYEEFKNIKNDWIMLEENDKDATYYSTFEYNFLLWNELKKDKNKILFIIAVYNESDLIGIAPLMLVHKKKLNLSYNILEFITWGDFKGFILNNKQYNVLNIIKEIFDFIEKNNNLWDKINLTHIVSNSNLAKFIFKNIRYNKYFKYLIENPRLYFNKFNDFDDYKSKYISSSAKKYRNKLLREVGYKFCVIKNDEENIYDEISSIHKLEQKYLYNVYQRKERKSLFNNHVKNAFINNLYRENSNVITFLIKTSNNELLIYDTCYIHKGILHSWNMAFNPKYEKYNLGRIINYEIMKYIFESNIVNEFDFGAGRYPWKFEWTSDFVLTYKLELWNKNSKHKFVQKLLKIKKAINNFK